MDPTTERFLLGWMLDLLDTWRTARRGESVEIDGDPFLPEFAKEGAGYRAEVLADALTGSVDGRYAQIGKGLISFADRLGVYEGVAV